MHAQDTAHPSKTEYRGADWAKIQNRGTRGGRTEAGQRPAPASDHRRLGSRTHFDSYVDAVREYPGPSYLCIAKGYGQNGGKVTLRTMHERPQIAPHEPDPETTPTPSRYGQPRSQSDPVDLSRASWRARSQIEDWIRMTCTRDTDYRLCTGTRRLGFRTLQEVWAAVGALRKAIESHYPGVKMLAVPEIHHGQGMNQGTYHVHMVLVFPVGTRPVYSVFHRLWYQALGGNGAEKGVDTPGNFDFAKTHAPDGKRYTPCQAARYLGKYVTKDLFSGNVGQKRFTKSHGAPEPLRRYWWQPIALSHDMTRAHTVSLMREFYPADTHSIYSRTFSCGGDTYHVFSAEPPPD